MTGRFNNRSNATLYCWPVNACSWCISLRMTSPKGQIAEDNMDETERFYSHPSRHGLQNRCLGFQERDASRCFGVFLQQGTECELQYVVAKTNFLASFWESVDSPLRMYTNIPRCSSLVDWARTVIKITWSSNMLGHKNTWVHQLEQSRLVKIIV